MGWRVPVQGWRCPSIFEDEMNQIKAIFKVASVVFTVVTAGLVIGGLVYFVPPALPLFILAGFFSYGLCNLVEWMEK